LTRPTSSDDRDAMERDVIVVGSGASALTAAVTAACGGLRVLVIEKAPVFGGTSALSGGTAWIPDNPHVIEAGQTDSAEAAMRYLENVINRSLRREVLQAFVQNGRKMIEFLEANTEVRFDISGHPDYKSHLDGGLPVGRSIVAREYDGRRLGRWFGLLQPPSDYMCVLGSMMVDGNDLHHLMNMTRSPHSFFHAARRFLRFARDLPRYRRGTRLVMGNALIARLLKSAIDAGAELWHDSRGVQLILEDHRIAGVVVEQRGKLFRVRAKRGVLLAAGGFPHDEEFKKRFIPFADQHHTLCVDSDTGDGLRMALAVGAEMGGDSVQNFLGTQVTFMTDSNGAVISKMPFIRRDRNKPGFVMVNRDAQRFVSEAGPYNDVAIAVNNTVGAIPTFLVTDHVRLRRYGLGLIRPGPAWARPLGRYLKSGYLMRAPTIRELAFKLGMDPDQLERTVARNNAYARTGRDLDFGKGDNFYEQWQGDPAVSPNPNLGPIDSAPFYAVRLWPGNLGTTCGLITDYRARVLDTKGNPIAGLYAGGTDMHSIFSGAYPGGGSSIGPGMTFGYIAARDMIAMV
jgi:succinate dehydrogenase/fumarate reductase flavoprotein subunit